MIFDAELLLCSDGLHIKASLEAFLDVAKGKDNISMENPLGGDNYRIGELDGTCAYKTPAHAWEEVVGDLENPVSRITIETKWVVEFQGEIVNATIPEHEKGGVLVRVTDPGKPIRAKAFAEKYGFQLQADDGDGDIDLPYGDDAAAG